MACQTPPRSARHSSPRKHRRAPVPPPVLVPDPAVVRRLALLVAELPDARPGGRELIRALDARADAEGWPDSVRGALLWREAVDPLALCRLADRRGWPPGRVWKATPEELLSLFADDSVGASASIGSGAEATGHSFLAADLGDRTQT